MRIAQDGGEPFSLEDEFISRFPGLCIKCGFGICVCPAIPSATVGRMAKELDIADSESLFITDTSQLLAQGKEAANNALELAGGYPGIMANFPFDRGDVNRSLVMMCFTLADALEKHYPATSVSLRGIAIQTGSSVAEPGSTQSAGSTKQIVSALREAWFTLDPETKHSIGSSATGATAGIESILSTIRVLLIASSPIDLTPIRVSGEARAILEAIRLLGGSRVQVKHLMAATADDIRRALLADEYDVIHFCGHADSSSIVLEDTEGGSVHAPLSQINELVKRYPATKCVVLNACKAGTKLTAPMGPLTIAMESTIDDDSAVAFAGGFYEALAAGKDFRFAAEEGKNAIGLKGLPIPKICVLPETTSQHE
jgi:hypothetical protein